MNSRLKGFTIVEVVLFLAVTGIMIVGILATTGTGLNNQRYRDSIDSLQAFLQSQYTQTLTVQNDTMTNITCSAGSVVISTGGSTNRGQSNCVIMGRYITTSNSGKTLLTYPVVGYKTGSSTNSDDYSQIKNYTLTKIDSLVEDYTLQWDASMLTTAKTQSNFTILIARSPTSGSILTFITPTTANAALTSTSALLAASALTQPLVTCVSSTAGIGISGKMGVRVNLNASGATGVEMLGDGSGVCP